MNHRQLLGVLGVTMLLAQAGQNAKAAEPGDAAEGKRLAERTCTACHRVSADQADAPKLQVQAPSFVSVANERGMDPGLLHEFLTSKHKSLKTPPEMPSMLLSDAEADDLTAYIVSLKKTP